jgi:hypothetical protein
LVKDNYFVSYNFIVRDKPANYLDFKVVDSLAFFSSDRGLEIYNLIDPNQPQLLGITATDGNAGGIDVVGNFAYIADDYNGLCIIDISNPTSPFITGRYRSSGRVKDVKVQNNLAYLADGDSGLAIIDLGRWYQANFYVMKVFVADSFTYLGCVPSGPLKIINTADPINPHWIADYPTGGGEFDFIWDVFVIDTLALLAGDWTFSSGPYYNFMIINIKNPSNPILLAGLYFGLYAANGIAVQGDKAFIGNQDDGVRIIDISNPYAPIEMTHITEVGCAYGLDIKDSLLVTPNFYDGFTIFNVSNPEQPTLTSFHPSITWTGLALCDSLPELYLMGCIKNHSILKFLNIEDVSNPYTEAELHFLGLWYIRTGKGMCVDYPFLAIALSRGWPEHYFTSFIDLNQHRVIRSAEGTMSGPAEMKGSIVYSCDDTKLKLGDIWSNPFWVDSFALPYHATAAAIHDSFAYVACGEYLATLNLNQDTLISLLHHGHATTARLGGIQISGQYLYMNYEGLWIGLYCYDGFMIFDIGNPTTPQLIIDTFVTREVSSIGNVNLTNSCFVYDTLFFLEKDERGFEIWNVRDPAHPVQLLIQDTPGICRHINVKDNNIFVMDERSLEIYRLSETGITDATGKTEKSPVRLSLFPNPFHAAIKITYTYDKSIAPHVISEPLTLKIYNSLGQLVKSFKFSLASASTKLSVTWDGTDDQNQQLPNGIYFVTLDTEIGSDMVKIIKLR